MRQISRRTPLIIIVGTIASLLVVLTSLLVSTLTGIFSSLPLWIILVSIFVVAILATAFGLWYERMKSTPGTLAAAARENRQRVLELVQNKWITGFLENELYYDKVLLPLGLHRRVGDPYDPVLQNPLELAKPLPLGTTITEVFDQAEGKLLVLGELGAGKTTLLLELARDLLERAKADKEARIPVVLMLSSWSVKQLSLEQWIVKATGDEL